MHTIACRELVQGRGPGSALAEMDWAVALGERDSDRGHLEEWKMAF